MGGMDHGLHRAQDFLTLTLTLNIRVSTMPDNDQWQKIQVPSRVDALTSYEGYCPLRSYPVTIPLGSMMVRRGSPSRSVGNQF